MQKIINGISSLPVILREIGCKKLFLVVDSSYPYLNIRETIEGLQTDEKVMFSDFTSNPLYEQVCLGTDLLGSSRCDTILAVGGGSAIDVAKCIKLTYLAEEGHNAIIPPLVSQQLTIDGNRLPLIAIPTTAGTGSESTHNAVVYFNGEKQTVTNDGILPDYAILEPTVLKTLPLYQKKCVMMDALCQGIESWWSVNSTEESKVYSKKAVELIMANWRAHIFDNRDEAATQIMLAANYSGRAINIAQTTAAHAMSYKITSMYQLPHGHAVAVCLPEIWDYMASHMDQIGDSRGADYLAYTFSDIATSMGADGSNDAIMVFRRIMADLQLDKPKSANKESDMDALVHSVNPVRLKNNPVVLNEDALSQLYSRILTEADEDIMVSIRCAVYNHEPYLRECLDGFLMQKTSFRYEIVIHDDASTDHSVDIIREYARKYPDIIKPIYEVENQYSKDRQSISRILTQACRGKYFASCEGDDYWTDPLKLQKQIAFLESHPDYSMCCSAFTQTIAGHEEKTAVCMDRDEITLDDLLKECWIGTLTVVFRKDAIADYRPPYKDLPMGDLPLWCHLASKGRIKYIRDITGNYRSLVSSACHFTDLKKEYAFEIEAMRVREYYAERAGKLSVAQPFFAKTALFVLDQCHKFYWKDFPTEKLWHFVKGYGNPSGYDKLKYWGLHSDLNHLISSLILRIKKKS
jgi:alcohol dehydrogenase class IV/glycosyltransferase involved in cell wall biosynthesis